MRLGTLVLPCSGASRVTDLTRERRTMFMASAHRLRWTLATAALLVAACLTLAHQVTQAQSPVRRVDDGMLRNAAATGEDWLNYGLDPGEKRYSPLTQIDATNVSRLQQVWAFDIPGGTVNPPGGGNQEATLLASNGVLYGITTWSVVYAVDARTGKQLWKWDPEVNRPAVQSKICCGVVNRGVALFEDTVIAPIIDGRLVALNAATGRPVWEARVEYPQNQYTLTMAPRIAKGKVIVGASGAEYPVRGFVDAFDARTGQSAWRFYTVPGDPSKPFENDAMRKAAPTWSGEWYKMGGGATVWDGMSYDPAGESRLLRHGQRRTLARSAARIAGEGQPLRLLHHRGESRHRRDEVVLPGRAGRFLGLRLGAAADARRHPHQRPRPPRHHAGEQERLLLRARPAHRRVPLGVAVRAAQLVGGDGPEDGPTVHPSARVLRHWNPSRSTRARSARTTGRRCRSTRRPDSSTFRRRSSTRRPTP